MGHERHNETLKSSCKSLWKDLEIMIMISILNIRLQFFVPKYSTIMTQFTLLALTW